MDIRHTFNSMILSGEKACKTENYTLRVQEEDKKKAAKT